jgi:hypothetical protein
VEEDAYKRNPREWYECRVARNVDAGTSWRNSRVGSHGKIFTPALDTTKR